MKTPLLIWMMLWTVAFGLWPSPARAQTTVKTSDLQSITSFQSGDLLMIARPGDKNYKLEATTGLPNALGLGTAAFTDSGDYDPAGAGTTAATAATNGYPWGALYDPIGRAVAVTNGFPWGVLYDAAGTATAATNNFKDGRNLTNLLHSSTVSGVSGVSVALTQNADGSTNYGLTVTAGGSGTVTSVGLSAPSEFSVSGSPVTGAGTLSFTRTADANFLGFGATNLGLLRVGGPAGINTLVVTNAFTNTAMTANALAFFDANKKLTSIAPGVGVPTNDAAGNWGYTLLLDASALGASGHVKTSSATNLISSEDATGYTNTIAYTHQGTTTNITATFNGTLQTFTVTNGPTVFFSYAGANGSVSYRIISTNFTTLQFTYQPKWLAGSNNVITNGVLSLTSYGGTNATQIEAAMRENQ